MAASNGPSSRPKRADARFPGACVVPVDWATREQAGAELQSAGADSVAALGSETEPMPVHAAGIRIQADGGFRLLPRAEQWRQLPLSRCRTLC
jgi:hypothetical protein